MNPENPKVRALIFSDLSCLVGALGRPVGAHRVATALRNSGYDTEVIDFCLHLSTEEVIKAIDHFCDENTLMIGWSSTFLTERRSSPSYQERYVNENEIGLKKQDIDVIHHHIKTKYPNAKIVLGGTKAYTYGMSQADCYCIGYADTAVVELMNFFAGTPNDLKYSFTKDDKLVVDCNQYYPVTDMSKINVEWSPSDFVTPYEYLPIEISRGCRFKCTFCAYPLNGRKKNDYLRPIECLVNEFERNYEMFGTTRYALLDDTFNESVEKLEAFHQAVKRLDFNIEFVSYCRLDLLDKHPEMCDLLVESGLTSVFFGVETLHPEASKRIGKWFNVDSCSRAITRLKQAGPHVKSTAGFIVGLPEEPAESVYQTFEWVRDGGLFDDWEFNALSINNSRYVQYQSTLVKYPEKFGIQYDPETTYWSHKLMDRNEAIRIAVDIMGQTLPLAKPGAWTYAVVKALGPEAEYALDIPLSGGHWIDLHEQKVVAVRDYLYKKFLRFYL